MESWNHIINTALLGTEKKALRKEDLDAALAGSFDAVAQRGGDKEEAFLQTAALVYNYRQCGFLPLKKEASLPLAEAEEKRYASAVAHAVLKDLMEAGSTSLLQFWMKQCADRACIVDPGFIPPLFSAAVKEGFLQPLATAVCGKRGEWLAAFNKDWQWGEAGSGEERWQTGSPAQRKSVLAQTRQTDPATARGLLQQTWPQESAAAKAELLEEMLANLSDEDLPWLEEVAAEKSTKVKAVAERLLGLLPSSTLAQRYQDAARQSIRLIVSKGILGIGAKTSLEVQPSAEAKAIFKTGVEEEKEGKISEDGFVLKQLVGGVPPRFWEDHFSPDRKKLIALFAAEEKYGPFTAALVKAALRFKDLAWLRDVLAADGETFYEDALEVLPQAEAEEYALRFVTDEKVAGQVLRQIAVFTGEWSLPFAKAVLRFTAANPYQYHKGFYNHTAAVLPVPVVAELERCTPKEEHLRHMWSNLSEHITKLLTLKLQTLKAFNGNEP